MGLALKAKEKATAATESAKSLVKDSKLLEARSQSDTIRLWENYREQATLWRSIALMQLPITLLALGFSLLLWYTRTITLHVPREPLPGQYSAEEIPDANFIEASIDFINLIATYSPQVARKQFRKASEMMVEPVLSKFTIEMMNTESKVIESTGRIQVFFADPTKTKVQRKGKSVIIQVDGHRLKTIAGKELPPIPTRFLISLTTVPRNVLNPYGIVVNNYAIQTLSTKE